MIDKQLIEDCHIIGSFEFCTLLLHKNASVSWFILVPQTSVSDLMELPAEQCAGIMSECRNIASFLKQELAFEKINYASIGNIVPQLHIHIIGRKSDDACWPMPVWGHLTESRVYQTSELDTIADRLYAQYGLKSANTFC